MLIWVIIELYQGSRLLCWVDFDRAMLKLVICGILIVVALELLHGVRWLLCSFLLLLLAVRFHQLLIISL